jgi:O-antigen/teichoic acid export membrane protein
VFITAWFGWRAVGMGHTAANNGSPDYPISEAWSAVSFIGAGMILGSLERLITPGLLGMSALATFSLLATIAGSPFQMLHQGIGYTLVPGLRNAADDAARRRVLVHEGMVALATCIAAALIVWWVTPFLVRTVLADRYVISGQLVLAVICLGCIKVLGSVAAAAVNALGSGADLARMSLAGWLAIGVGLVAAWSGSHWGLIGLVYGAAGGWLVRAWVVGGLALRHFGSADDAGAPIALEQLADNAWE